MTVSRNGVEPYVYFLRPVGAKGPVKIGVSNAPKGRLEYFMHWSPVPLEIAATTKGGRELERNIQDCFADCHSHCEWFHENERLTQLIEDLNAGVALENALDLSDRRGNVLGLSQKATRAKNDELEARGLPRDWGAK